MKLVFAFVVFFLFLSCQDVSKSPIVEETFVIEEPKVEGQWELISVTQMQSIDFIGYSVDPEELLDAPVTESGPYFESFESLEFTKDSIYKIDYPMMLKMSGTFSIDTNYLTYFRGESMIQMPIHQKGDTLRLYQFGDEGYNLEATYVKTTFNDSIVGFLKKYQTNYPELAGTWYLKRDYYYDYGTHYWLEFDHTIPDSITLTREDMLVAIDNGNQIEMLTDGRLRTYEMGFARNYLYLYPGDWNKGEDPMMHFDTERPERDLFKNDAFLADTWYLIRDIETLTTEYHLDFDYEIPDSIVLTEPQILTAIENDSTIYMMTDGELKPYRYDYDFIGSVLFLRPGSWYEGEDPWLHYDIIKPEATEE